MEKDAAGVLPAPGHYHFGAFRAGDCRRQEEQAEEVRGTTGASFTVERNLSTGGWTSGAHGSYSTQEFVSEEMLQEIASVDGIAGYDAAVVSMPSYYNEAGEELVNGNVINSYYTYGSINTEYNQLFSSGRFDW